MVRVDFKKFRFELVAGADIDRDHLVGKAQLFESDMHLMAIGGRPGPDFKHRGSLLIVVRNRLRAILSTACAERNADEPPPPNPLHTRGANRLPAHAS